jgi:ABC-type Mn2+/Zn2+ transport system permease subunit
MRPLLIYGLFNGVLHILILVSLGIVAIVMGNTVGRLVGIALLVAGVACAVTMMRSFAKRSAKPS